MRIGKDFQYLLSDECVILILFLPLSQETGLWKQSSENSILLMKQIMPTMTITAPCLETKNYKYCLS